MDLAALLNPEQLAAVTHSGGPLLVFAGAGSGKTRVIVHRIAHAIRERGVHPYEVLAVTFTNKAAGEMRERLAQLIGPVAEGAWVSTFHALAARLLRREAASVPQLGLTRDFAIYDESDQLALMKRVLKDLGSGAEPRPLLQRIDRWQNAGLGPDEVRVHDWDVPERAARKAYGAYAEALRRANAVDFGGLLVRAIELLTVSPEAGERYAGRFRQVLVDEFQDTNPAQYQLLRLLSRGRSPNGGIHQKWGTSPPPPAGEAVGLLPPGSLLPSLTGGITGSCELCVVGDDDQSIYRWRGAEVQNILSFDKDFPGATVVKLEQNYRSTGQILAAAHAVISKNEVRAPKKLWTRLGDGEKPRLVIASDERDEAATVARMIAAAHSDGVAWNDVAIFYRTNAQSRVHEDALRSRNIPYAIVRGRSFYDRAEVKDIAAYLRLSLNPRSDADLARVINVPSRGIGDTTVEKVTAHARALSVSLWDALRDPDAIPGVNAGTRAKLAAFRALVDELVKAVQTATAAESVEAALAMTGYAERLEAEEDGADRVENLYELVAAAKEYDRARDGDPEILAARPALAAAVASARTEGEEPESALAGFLQHLALAGDADGGDGPAGQRVALMTLHAAKGLEFLHVYLTGLEERVFPHSRSVGHSPEDEDPDSVAEERRLMYVGITRARRRLVLSLARSRSLFGELKFNLPSRFLKEIPPELLEGAQALRRVEAPSWSQPRREFPKTYESGERVVYDEPRADDEASQAQSSWQSARRPGTARAGMSPIVDSSAWPRGTHVRHATFGAGKVEGSSGDKLTVRFDSVGVKTVLARFLSVA